jgi:hypothetical protein
MARIVNYRHCAPPALRCKAIDSMYCSVISTRHGMKAIRRLDNLRYIAHRFS